MPFSRLGDAQAPIIRLEVVGPTEFSLVEGFRYRNAFHPQEEVEVEAGPTDLASVPFFLQWLVRSYGRHTMAALVHDQLWGEKSSRHLLRRANRIFRQAMWELHVPLIRRWLMWTGVTAGMLSRFCWGRVQLLIWTSSLAFGLSSILGAAGWSLSGISLAWVVAISALIAGSGLVASACSAPHSLIRKYAGMACVVGVAIGALALVAAATVRVRPAVDHPRDTVLLCLLVGLLAWTDLVGAGMIATVSVLVLLVPVAAVLLALLAYELIESVAWLSLKAGRRIAVEAGKQPRGPLNTPAKSTLW